MLMNATELDNEELACDFIYTQVNEQILSQLSSLDELKTSEVLLIDSGSTCSVIMNPNILIDIHDSDQTLRAVTNGGHQDSHMKAYLPGFFEVWYNPASLLNILSFSDVSKRFRITVDTKRDNSINVHLDDGNVLSFKCMNNGLYMANISDIKSKSQLTNYSFVSVTSREQQTLQSVKLKERTTLGSCIKELVCHHTKNL